MADEVEITEQEQQVFEAVAALEGSHETATIAQVAAQTGLDERKVEELLGRLTTTHDLVREVRVENDPDATGVGREYVVKTQPSPS